MADTAVRVALLARAGKAREQLHKALTEGGASIVAEGDPAELDPATVAAAAPTCYLVSLEPAAEAALERFDELLAAPDVEVMFDDAEVTSKLDGWDLNRWARHIASKLLGGEFLPAAPMDSEFTGSEVMPVPGAPPTPAELMDSARLEDYTVETSELASSVPTSPSLTGAASEESSGQFTLDTDFSLDFDLSSLELGEAAARASAPAPELSQPSDSEFGELNLGKSISFSSFQDGAVETFSSLDADVAELAAQLDAFEKTDQRQAASSQYGAADDESGITETIDALDVVGAPVAEARTLAKAPAPAAAPAAMKAASFDFSNLALAPMDEVAQSSAAAAPVSAAASASGPLSLDTAPSSHDPVGLDGVVVILAGLGGPDAVRQLLSSLPEALSVPVLLYQHLEVGKHERLVEQLAKISRLPVLLAREGTSPEAGKVTLLPAGMTAVAQGSSLVFAAGGLVQMINALPPENSVIVVLSGAEAQLVPTIIAVKAAGGLVLAQDPDVCFDSAAADAMRQQGAAVFPALGLARQIAARWSL